MKKYKMLIISLLLFVFMMGAVSAADENVADDNLEIADEISVDEAVASDVVEDEVGAEDQSSLDDEVLNEPPSDAIEIVLDEEATYDDLDTIESYYGTEKNLTFKFSNNDNTPYSNGEVVFHVYKDRMDEVADYPISTDSEGYAYLPLTWWAFGENDIIGFTVGGTDYDFYAPIEVGFDGVIVYVDDDTFHTPIKLVYGEEKYFKTVFTDCDGNIYSNMDVKFNMFNAATANINDPSEDIFVIEATTDEHGIASFLIDFDIGYYSFYFPTIDGDRFNLQCQIQVYDPEIKGYMRLEVYDSSQKEGVIAYGQSIRYTVWILDQIENPMPNTLFYYTVNDVTYNATTTQRGNYILTIDSLPVGNYSIVVSYPEADLSMNTTLYVVEDITTLHADNLTVVIGDGFEYAVKLTDKLGRPKADQYVTMYMGSQRIGVAYPDENGIAIFDLDLDVGVYNNIRLIDSYGSPGNPTIIVLANPSISTPVDTSFNCSSGANQYAMSFTNINGTPLANGAVEVSIDGAYNYTLTTDENGTADFILPTLAGGDHIMTITNPVTGEKITTTITYMKEASSISTAAVTTVYNGGKYVVFTLKDSNGVALSGKDVSVVLNGKTIKGVTDANGQFKVSTDGLAPKAYTATITFAGDDYLVNSTATAKITVKKATPKMTAKKATFKAKKKTKKYSIVLKDNKNKAMKKVKVTLKVGKKTYKATTNSKGKATFKINKLTKKGKYTAKVKFAGNKNYNAVTKKVKITVKK